MLRCSLAFIAFHPVHPSRIHNTNHTATITELRCLELLLIGMECTTHNLAYNLHSARPLSLQSRTSCSDALCDNPKIS